MTCYHPLRAFTLGLKENGKRDIKIVGADCDTLIYDKICKSFDTSYFKDIGRGTILSSRYKLYRDSMLVPCGQCVGCRLDYSRQWATRLMLEKKYSKDAWFLTLTYDDDFLPMSKSVNQDTGELREVGTLVKKHLQLFIKRLRYYCPNLRYYAVGEYGDLSARPHYHLIMFNLELPPDDFRFYKRDNGNNLYTSETIRHCWKYGISILGEVSWQSCAYVARYVMKKQRGKASKVYDDYCIEKPFTTMSLKPSIGSRYFCDNKDLLIDNPHIVLADGNVAPLPKSFFRYIDDDIAEEMKEDKRVLADELRRTKEMEYGLPYLEILKIEEEFMKSNAKKFLRE